MAITVEEVIRAAEKELSLTPGSAVQKYAEDGMRDKVKTTFDLVIKQLWWPEYMQWFQSPLDGVNGWATTDLTTIRTPKDVRIIFDTSAGAPKNRRIHKLPLDVNPFALSGNTVQFYSPYNAMNANYNRRIRFWPNAAAGTVAIHARVYPISGTSSFTDETVLHLDEDLLIWGVCWAVATDDGAVPQQAQRYEKMFDSRFRDLRKELNNEPEVTRPAMSIPMDWYEK